MQDDIKIVARYYANGELITDEEFKDIVFSHYIIDEILFAVNQRLGLTSKVAITEMDG